MDTKICCSSLPILVIYVFFLHSAYSYIHTQFGRKSKLSNRSCKSAYLLFNGGGLNDLQCVRLCVHIGNKCKGVFYQSYGGQCEACNNMTMTVPLSHNRSEAYVRLVDSLGCTTENDMVAPVTDEQLSESSRYLNGDLYGAKYARLHTVGTTQGTGAWSADDLNTEQFVQVNFGELRHVVGVATQGRDHNRQWVTQYRVLTSVDCKTFNYVKENGTIKLFPGNTDRETVVMNRFSQAITARCVRVNPTLWDEYPSLRFGVIGCRL